MKLASTGSYLPGDPIDNEQMERLAGPVPEDVLEGLQVKTRHWCVDPNSRWKYGGMVLPWTAAPVPQRAGLSQAAA